MAKQTIHHALMNESLFLGMDEFEDEIDSIFGKEENYAAIKQYEIEIEEEINKVFKLESIKILPEKEVDMVKPINVNANLSVHANSENTATKEKVERKLERHREKNCTASSTLPSIFVEGLDNQELTIVTAKKQQEPKVTHKVASDEESNKRKTTTDKSIQNLTILTISKIEIRI